VTPLDPDNPVVRLCVAGIAAEGAGRGEEAAALYRTAWQLASDNLERSAAAHYLARADGTAVGRLRWNRAALEHALAAGDSAATFLPSLYLNLGHSLEEDGDLAAAQAAYRAAELALTRDPGLAESLRPALVRAAERVARANESG
jgi:hypothetical protein